MRFGVRGVALKQWFRQYFGASRSSAAATMGDTLWGLALEFTRLLSSMVSFFVLWRALGRDAFGAYSAIIALTGVLASSGIGWISQWYLESIVRLGSSSSRSASLAASMSVWGAAATLVAMALIGPFLLSRTSAWVILVFLLAEWLNQGSVIGASVIQATAGFGSATRTQLVLALARAALFVSLGVSGSATIARVGVALCVTNLGLVIWVSRRAIRMSHATLSLRSPSTRVLGQGLPYAATNLAYTIQEDLDKALLDQFGRAGDSGPYAGAYRMMSIGLIPVKAIVAATHVRFLDTGRTAGRKGVIRLASNLTMIGLVVSILVSAGLLVLRPVFVWVLGEDFRAAADVLPWLLPALLLRSASWFPLNGQMGIGLRRMRVLALTSSAIIGLTANLVLIPWISWKGAVLATLLSEIVFTALAWGGLVWGKLRETNDEVIPPDVFGSTALVSSGDRNRP